MTWLTQSATQRALLTYAPHARRCRAESLFNLKILRLSWQRIPKIENLDAFTHVADLYLQYVSLVICTCAATGVVRLPDADKDEPASPCSLRLLRVLSPTALLFPFSPLFCCFRDDTLRTASR